MLSIHSTEPPKLSVSPGELFIDFLLGWCPPAAVAFGSFALADPYFFIVPGTVLVPFAHFAMGSLRGKSQGNVWLKALCLSGPTLLLAEAMGTRSILLTAAGLSLPPAVAGLWLRRRDWFAWRSLPRR